MNVLNRIATVLAAAADAFTGTIVSACVNMGKFNNVSFVIHKAAGATGTSTVTVEKCTLADGTGNEAIPFNYRRITGAGFTAGAWAKATSSGFNTTAGANELYEIQVSGNWEGIAAADKKYARVKMVEVVDSPVTGGILVILGEARHGFASNALT